jgi:ligand-binding sensor domain-containing protein
LRKQYTISFLVFIVFPGFFLIPFTSEAQQFNNFHVQLIRNTNSSTFNMAQVEEMHKDNKGFLWLLSASKLARYDGRQSVLFPITQRYYHLAEDEHGRIWLSQEDNIYRYENDVSGFKKIFPDTIKKKFANIVYGPSKKLWICSSTGIETWDEQTNSSTPVARLASWKNAGSGFLSSYNDCLFFARGNTIFRYCSINDQIDSIQTGQEARNITFLNEDSAWLGCWNGKTYQLSFTANTATEVKPQQFDDSATNDFFYIMDGFRFSKNEFFVLVRNKGCFMYNSTTGHFTRIKFFFNGLPLASATSIYGLYRDNKNVVWLFHEEGLLYYKSSGDGFGLLRSDGLEKGKDWSNTVRNFAEDKEGNIWFSTANGFNKWQKKDGAIKSWFPRPDASNYLNYPSVRGIAYDGKNLVLAQSEGGHWLFDPVKETFQHFIFPKDSAGAIQEKTFNNDFNWNIVQLKNGNFLSLCRSRIYLIEKNTYRVSEIKLEVNPRNNRVAYEDDAGRIWILGAGGVTVCDGSFKQLYSIPNAYPGISYSSMLQTGPQTFWLVAKGIDEITLEDNGRSSRKKLFPAMRETTFFNTFKDSTQHIWISSEQGLYRYNPGNESLELFDNSDNIASNHYSFGQPYRSKTGYVLLPGFNGISYFFPEKIPLQNDSLQVFLLNVTINKDASSWLLQKRSSFNYNQNAFVFDFVAPYFFNAGKVQYRYMLKGIDKDWINTGNNTSVRFTSLEPGSYSFKVAASLNGRDWFDAKQSFSFVIHPPLWQTWWFRLLCIVAAFMAAYFLFRRRVDTIKSRESRERAYEKKIAEVEMSSLRAQMNPHFMFNSLNSINNFILKNDPDNASGYLTKFSRLMRLILDNSRSEWVLLESELKALELYIDLEVLRFDHTFTCSIEVAQDINPGAIMIPPMVIQPYVENAIWHGLMHRENPGGRLDIRAWKTNNTLHVEIEDNGIGREEATKRKSKTATRHKSHGMQITEQRLDIVNKLYNANAIVTIHDMINANGTAAGTSVLLSIDYKTQTDK